MGNIFEGNGNENALKVDSGDSINILKFIELYIHIKKANFMTFKFSPF